VTFGAGVLFFPISYVFGDVLTEVYGYARARRVIWSGFAALIFAAVMASVVVALPHAPNWPNQAAYEIAFGNTWRIALASMCAYFCGEFVNSYVLAKMKVATNGRYQGARFVGSTIAGEAVDSALFYPLAFYNSGIMPNELVVTLAIPGRRWALRRGCFPARHLSGRRLPERRERDYYDRGTDFRQFKIET
jgi:uncharacterized integral membrane protein (TIGR00697 family)